MVDHIADEVDQVILGQPLTQARWQQKVLFRKVRPVALAHDTLCTTPLPIHPPQSHFSVVGHFHTAPNSLNAYFSDTLLGAGSATTLNTRGRTLAVIRSMTPPVP